MKVICNNPNAHNILKVLSACGYQARFFTNEPIYDIFDELEPDILITDEKLLTHDIETCIEERPALRVAVQTSQNLNYDLCYEHKSALDLFDYKLPFKVDNDFRCDYVFIGDGPNRKIDKFAENKNIRLFGYGWGGVKNCGPLLTSDFVKAYTAAETCVNLYEEDMLYAILWCNRPCITNIPRFNHTTSFPNTNIRGDFFRQNKNVRKTILSKDTYFNRTAELIKGLGLDNSNILDLHSNIRKEYEKYL